VYGGLVLLSLTLFYVVSTRDPGYVRPDFKLALGELFENFEASYICYYCESLRTPHTKHCLICERCVKHFDHHCPWVNNCIGRGYLILSNFKAFLSFIIVLQLEFIVTLAACVVWIVDFYAPEKTLYSSPLSPENARGLVYTAAVVSGVCVIAVSPLLYVQLTNFCMKTTTRERFAVRLTQRKLSTLSQRSNQSCHESEQLIRAERDLLVPLSIDSSALTNGFVYIAQSRAQCCPTAD
jgi:hypothetical protein